MTRSKGLYIHIPFCDYHCYYCSFVTFVTNPERVEKYVDYVVKEMDLYRHENYSLDTIYFGGGTPSILSGEQMTRMMQAIEKSFQISSGAEISTEMNPESITREKLSVFQSLGFNRFSVGAQSFSDQVLTMMGRIHRREDIFQRIQWMKDLGIDNISIDLMFNNPGQTLEVLKEDLDQALSLDIDHLSIYSLMIEPGTQFERWLKKGQIHIQEDDQERAMYNLIQDTLKEEGFKQYEISNFARPGKMCRHNLKYWRQEDYLGIGVGAAGNIGSSRYENQHDFINYYHLIDEGKRPIRENIYLTEQEREVEYIMLNMRLLDGMSIKQLNQRYHINFLLKYQKAVDKHLKTGLIELSGDYLRFTDRGLDLTNQFYLDLM